ncbi:C69 family dipeptidase [Streptomyces sp. NBC_01716]|uniref:C69 family dipeptidase n=1 Tax=Streptomyces sp. NBC_01716 TaxID=2975917 RepID=UPI002E2FF803|nr:C69 family dipeptidase [Streptomyces sp. NBC_01716]
MTSRPWSCDTFVALPDTTRRPAVLFGKNSDRPAGEAQPLRHAPARPAGEPLRLAYVTLDDAPAYAHIGSAPYWCWGYEMGVNERRVAIGNEAVFTRPWADAVAREKAGDHQRPGVLGMELVRLGLERGGTAREALDVITSLLERYGQWGSATVGAPHADGAYDNAYVLADPHEAWVLETLGRDWAARRITTGVTPVSNELSLRTDADLTSRGLRDAATAAGWPADRPLDVADAFTDPGTPLQVSHIRRRRARQLLAEGAATATGVGIGTAKRVLRDHLEDTFLGGPSFDAARPDFHTLCMHEHPSGFTWGNTAASLIVELHAEPGPLTLWWCPTTPCTGVYLPVPLEVETLPEALTLPLPGPSRDPRDHPRATHDPASVWWQWQHLLDAAKEPGARDFTARAARLRASFDALEARWADALPTSADDPAALTAFTRGCLDEARAEAAALAGEFGADPARALDSRWAASAV